MWRLEKILIALAIVYGLLILSSCLIDMDKARSHDWYPLECCHGMDCAPVDGVDIMRASTVPGLPQTGMLVVTTKHGTAVVPPNLPRRESKDHRMHACMRPGENGTMRLICVFVPPGS